MNDDRTLTEPDPVRLTQQVRDRDGATGGDGVAETLDCADLPVPSRSVLPGIGTMDSQTPAGVFRPQDDGDCAT